VYCIYFGRNRLRIFRLGNVRHFFLVFLFLQKNRKNRQENDKSGNLVEGENTGTLSLPLSEKQIQRKIRKKKINQETSHENRGKLGPEVVRPEGPLPAQYGGTVAVVVRHLPRRLLAVLGERDVLLEKVGQPQLQPAEHGGDRLAGNKSTPGTAAKQKEGVVAWKQKGGGTVR